MTPLLCAVICVLRPFFSGLGRAADWRTRGGRKPDHRCGGFWFTPFVHAVFVHPKPRNPHLPAKLHVIGLISRSAAFVFDATLRRYRHRLVRASFINMTLKFLIAGPRNTTGPVSARSGLLVGGSGRDGGRFFWSGAVLAVLLSILGSLQTLARPAIRMASTASQIGPMGIRIMVSFLGFWK
jgi:hypothetical protein